MSVLSVLCNCLSGKQKAQFSEVEVNKDTFTFRLSVPSAQTHSPLWSPLGAQFTLPPPFWAWQEPLGVFSLCFTPCVLGSSAKVGQRQDPKILGSWECWLKWGETLPLARAGVTPLYPCHLLPTGGNAVLLGPVCVPAGCCCYSMATGSNHINGISHSRKVIKDSVTRHGLLLAW